MTQEQKHSKRKRCCEGDLVAWVSPLPGQAQAPAQVRSWQGPLHLLRVLLAQQASCAEPAAPLRESQALQERCKAGATDFEQPFLSSTLGCFQCPDTVYTLIGTTPPQVLSLRCFVRGTDSPVWKDCLPVLSPSSTGNNKCWLLLLRLRLIPVHVAELQFPRTLTAPVRARLVSGSGVRVVWRRLMQRCIVLMVRSAVLLAATETLR